MSSTTESTPTPEAPMDGSQTHRLKQDIEETREGLSETIAALEEKLSPSQVREAVGAELQHVEDRVRAVLSDQLATAKAAVHEELAEAKAALRDGLRDAERLLKTGLTEARESLAVGLGQAKESVKHELKDAMSGASESIRAATLGRVENFATAVGDTMNDARDTLIDTIYKNPIPATVTGLGLMWLLMNRSRAASDRSRGSATGNGGYAGAVGSAVGRVADRAGGAVTQGMHGAQSLAADALEGASGVVTSIAHSATEGAGQAMHSVSEGASALADNARQSAKRVERAVQRTMQDRPIAVGAAALAVGTVVGCLLPGSEAENQLIGQTRDNLLHRAGDAVQTAASSVTETIEHALQGEGESRRSGAQEQRNGTA